MAWYTQQALRHDPENLQWGIRAYSFRSPHIANLLSPQNNLYTLVTRDNHQQNFEVIGALHDVRYYPDDPAHCLLSIASESTKIVSLTVTEKGYCLDPATGNLDVNHEDLRLDLLSPASPRTVIGVIVKGLQQRKSAGAGPLTIISCDNLAANGKTLARAVKQFAALTDPDLLAWLDDEISFPNCVVDRIVPATTATDFKNVQAELRLVDNAAVVAETYAQWVIEDDFKAGRPAWESAGALLVPDITDYEILKLCLLNASHSACAYLGYLAGIETIAKVLSVPAYESYLRRMMTTEIIPGLNHNPSIDPHHYMATVLERFANHQLAHKTSQVAMDGSQKIPLRILGSIKRALEQGLPIDCLTLCVAAWMRYATGVGESGNVIDVSDPMAQKLEAIFKQHGHDFPALVTAYLGIEAIFDREIASDPRMVEAATRSLRCLYENGAAETVASYGAVY
jgi:fructuronate reductase